MAGYATQELAEKLAALSTAQRSAIARIVQHVYIHNRPWAGLFADPEPICREDNYYRRGQVDEQSGRWVRKPGWGHDKEFQDALAEAVRLALQAQTREEMAAIQTAKRRARLAAPGVVDSLVQVATLGESKLRAAAGKVLLDYASASTPEGEGLTASEADDWWKAVEVDANIRRAAPNQK